MSCYYRNSSEKSKQLPKKRLLNLKKKRVFFKEEDEGLTISSIFGSAKVSQESDNILIIQQKKLSTANSGNIKYLEVV